MKGTTVLAAAITAGLASLAYLPDAHAALTSRLSVQEAAGGCQPFAPTSSIRYSATSVRNAGTAQFYVVCSMAGTWMDSANGGATYTAVIVNNPTASPQSVACTARPGYVYGTNSFQAASPRSATVPAGSFHVFSWTPTDFGATGIRNANFTCTLRPGMEVQYTEYNYQEEIGT